jgi:transposase
MDVSPSIKRAAKKLPEMQQSAFQFQLESPSQTADDSTEVAFHEGNPSRLFVGDVPLDKYLEQNGLGYLLRLSGFLQDYDFSVFKKAYRGGGRYPIHPRIMLGLIIYGMLIRQWSLRDLEGLATRDVGAWWVCGGLRPDHSTIGKFINLHADVLSESFFISITQELVRKLKLKTHDVAGDGTVIEAASSHFKVLKAESAHLAAEEAKAFALAHPEDKKAQAKAHVAQDAADTASQRQAARDEAGKSSEIKVSMNEPEAAVQLQKNKTFRPSYKPSILVDQNRLIIGQHVHPTSETIAIEPMLEHHREIYGALPKRTLLDAGYHSLGVLQIFVSRELDVLCPQGAVDKTGEWQKESHIEKFIKNEFEYDEVQDVYLCPDKKTLVPKSSYSENGRRYTKYRCDECAPCPLRVRCTESKHGRTIKRYEGEELKDAMNEVMRHPLARKKYRRRKVIVEPVFAELRERQNLKRFHRRGLQKVKIEFALHCVAHNLKRASRLEGERILLVFNVFGRENEGAWQFCGTFFTISPFVF